MIYCNHSLLPCCTFIRYMVTNSVLLSHTVPLIISSFIKTIPINDTDRSSAADFGQFQRISVGTSDKTIRVPVALPMKEAPYRKALVAQQFIRKIKHLATNNTFSHRDLMSTVVSYFDFETGIAKTGSESAILLVHRAIFSINNF